MNRMGYTPDNGRLRSADDVVRVGIVNYLNTKPFLYGLKNHAIYQSIDLIEAHPADCGRLMVDQAVDVCLVPTALLAEHTDWQVFSSHCIGCDGPVYTVVVAANEDLSDLQRIYLDHHSRTSVALLKWLMARMEHTKVTFQQASVENRELGKGEGALFIGDKAFAIHGKYRMIFDLGAAWKAETNLPFVFATWVASSRVSPTFRASFDEALSLGVESIPKVISHLQPAYTELDLTAYFERYIRYDLDNEKRRALSLFLNALTASYTAS